MPWKASTLLSERMAFVTRLLGGERMTELCAEYGISRKTGYKFKDRYDALGPAGLYEVSRRPRSSPGTTPIAIRTDNGAPFASTGLFGLTRLSAYWLKLGIALERIDPGKPQQNGRHERMHRTLKHETTRPAAGTLLGQQERFDAWVSTFNETRPHEALGQEAPATVYKPSPRSFVAGDASDYPLHDEVRRVSPSGHIRLLRGRNRATYLSPAIGGERVGIRELEDGTWLVSFASLDLGRIEPKTLKLIAADHEATN